MNRRSLLALALLAPAAALAHPITGPQPPLPTAPLTIIGAGGTAHRFQVEIARTRHQQTIGLMFRPSVPADGGMLFPWPRPIVSQMWMKNTLVPLDMVFIGADGRIASILTNTVPHSLRVLSSHGKVIATLELAGGTTARLGIVVGDRVVLPPGVAGR
jgi:uncharacterized membrane protein (UPF0127 family)